jgi:hypothetical protein
MPTSKGASSTGRGHSVYVFCILVDDFAVTVIDYLALDGSSIDVFAS